MKLLKCPLNGLRNISEFTYGGECHPMPSDQTCDAKEWAEYLFFHDNLASDVIEWWCHTATSYWFLAERNTVTDTVLRTFSTGDVFKGRTEFNVVESEHKNEQ
ncbi:MAG: sarcosine oxidase subunit delta [Ostreibacterium sp.]